MIGTPRHLLELVSPYFVPMQEGFDYLQSLARQGVEIRILTNSLAATDVVAVHAGYARWRRPLLEAGVTLHEYKPAAPAPPSGTGRRGRGAAAVTGSGRAGAPAAGSAGLAGSAGSVRSGGSVGAVGSVGSVGPRASLVRGGSRGAGRAGSSTSSPHAKTFLVDRMRVVIGSFNFDPRSLDLNTELRFVIDSAVLAIAVDAAYTRNVPLTAWQVTLDDAGKLQWSGLVDGEVVHFDDEPEAGFWRRAGAAAVSLLPLDWML